MKKRTSFRKSALTGAAVLLGALGVSATEPIDVIRPGVLVSKTTTQAVVRDCATDQLVVVGYGNAAAFNFLVGESIGFTQNAVATQSLLVVNYPEQIGCGHYHS